MVEPSAPPRGFSPALCGPVRKAVLKIAFSEVELAGSASRFHLSYLLLEVLPWEKCIRYLKQ